MKGASVMNGVVFEVRLEHKNELRILGRQRMPVGFDATEVMNLEFMLPVEVAPTDLELVSECFLGEMLWRRDTLDISLVADMAAMEIGRQDAISKNWSTWMVLAEMRLVGGTNPAPAAAPLVLTEEGQHLSDDLAEYVADYFDYLGADGEFPIDTDDLANRLINKGWHL